MCVCVAFAVVASSSASYLGITKWNISMLAAKAHFGCISVWLLLPAPCFFCRCVKLNPHNFPHFDPPAIPLFFYIPLFPRLIHPSMAPLPGEVGGVCAARKANA